MNWAEGQFILIDKPKEWTSFDVVNKLRYHLKVKMGHAGTLDPLATGLLILATGKFTKRIDEVQAQDKTYTGIIEIGKTTPSYDLETPFDSESDFAHVTVSDLEKAASALTGLIDQIPPAHSAIRVDGERAYKKARKNEKVKLKSRQVMVHSFLIGKVELPEVHFQIHCSKGTYIRTMAHDFGQMIGSGGYLKELHRTKIGNFDVEDALTIEEFIAKYPKA